MADDGAWGAGPGRAELQRLIAEGVDLNRIRVRWTRVTERIEAYNTDGPDARIRSVSFPLGAEPTVAQIIESMNKVWKHRANEGERG